MRAIGMMVARQARGRAVKDGAAANEITIAITQTGSAMQGGYFTLIYPVNV